MRGSDFAMVTRRAAAVALAAAPFVVATASLLTPGSVVGARLVVASICAALAAVVTLFNIHWVVVRPLLWSKLGKGRPFRHTSAAPLLGNLFATTGLVVGFGSLPIAVVGLAALVLDLGGIPWFVAYTWKQDGLYRSGESGAGRGSPGVEEPSAAVPAKANGRGTQRRRRIDRRS